MNSNDTDQLEAQLQNLFIKASPTCDPVYFAYQAIQLIAQHEAILLGEIKQELLKFIAGHDQPMRDEAISIIEKHLSNKETK